MSAAVLSILNNLDVVRDDHSGVIQQYAVVSVRGVRRDGSLNPPPPLVTFRCELVVIVPVSRKLSRMECVCLLGFRFGILLTT